MRATHSDYYDAEQILQRVPLLRRVLQDVVATHEIRGKKKERLEELIVVSRKFHSVEIHETINSLRNQVAECNRDLEAYQREIRLIGGTLKDPERGLVYFNARREGRAILLVWDLRQPDLVSWHEVDESFADRTPVEFHPGAATSAVDYPDG